MVSSATDPYQPAELKYGLTRKCIEVLQEYNIPYNTIIHRFQDILEQNDSN